MPQLIPTRQVPMTSETSNTTLPTNLFSNQYQAMQGLAQGVADIGQAAYNTGQDLKNADIDREHNATVGYINEKKRLMDEYIRNPENTYEKYAIEWDKHVKDIENYVTSLKHSESRQWASGYIAENKPVWRGAIDDNTHVAMVESSSQAGFAEIESIISSDMAAETDAVNSERFKTNLDSISEYDLKIKHIKDVVDRKVLLKIWPQDKAQAILDQATLKIEKQKTDSLFASMEQTIANYAAVHGNEKTEQMLADPQFIRDAVVENGYTLSDLSQWLNISQNFAGTERTQKARIEAAVDQLADELARGRQAAQAQADLERNARIESFKTGMTTEVFDAPTNDFLAIWPEARRQTQAFEYLDQDEKDKLKAKGDARFEAIARGEPDPILNFDAVEYFTLSNRIVSNPNSVSEGDIRTANLPPKDKEDLIGLRQRQINEPTTPESTARSEYRTAIKALIQDSWFSKNKYENLNRGVRILAAFDAFSKEPHTTLEYQDFYNSLIDTSGDDSWWWDFLIRKKAQNRKRMDTLIPQLEKSYVKPPLTEQDEAALHWAELHPDDPRSIEIKAKLGRQ